MSYDDARTSHLRLSHADRDAAVAALTRAEAEGRLTSDELAERSAAAGRAVTRGDLAPLFTDLPDTDAGPLADPAPSASAPSTSAAATAPGVAASGPSYPAGGYGAPKYGYPDNGNGMGPGYGGPGYGGYDDPSYGRPAPLGGAAGVAALSVTPFIALGLFLACGFLIPGGFAWAWIFWLFVPIVGIVVWGPAGRGHGPR